MDDEDAIGTLLLDAAFKIHRQLGPGLLESAYEAILVYELKGCGLTVRQQVLVPIVYEQLTLHQGYRADLIIEDRVIVEIKSIEFLQPVHTKQLLTYLRLARKRLGYVLNFGQYKLKDGISRVLNG
ncbi:MAG: GxxExxY protein [Verrucomicrobia bacterium]|nr:GxxExxY protein [Verrucomicrobiota bacterium]